jgi:hypothetical protein
MYNYNYKVYYKHIRGNEGDTTYRKHLLKACNLKEWCDTDVIDIQNSIYEKFKDNEKFTSIFKKGMEYGFQMPFKMDEKITMSFLFSFDYYENFHKCIKDLYNNNKISNDNFKEIINLLS